MNFILKTTLLLTILTSFFSDVKAISNPRSSQQARKELANHPPGVLVYLNANSGDLNYQLVFEYKEPSGKTFERTVSGLIKSTKNDIFIPALFKGSSDGCPYAPRLKRALFDLGRRAHSCGYSMVNYDGARPVREGQTNWKICLTDLYRSHSAFRGTCKNDGEIDVVAYDENGHILVPTGNHRGSACAPAW